MDIPEKIYTLRKEAGLSQKKLADAIGVSMMTLRRYETGERSPSSDAIKKLADVFHVPVSEFYGQTPESNEDIARLAVKALDDPILQKTVKLLNGLTTKQLILTLLYLEALTQDPND